MVHSNFTEQDIKQINFHQEKSLEYFQSKDFEKAIIHTIRWQQLVEKSFGNESAEMADCYCRLACICMRMKLSERKREEILENNIHDFVSLVQYFHCLLDVFYWLNQNLQMPMLLWQEGYDIIKKAKGLNDSKTQKYKEDYVDFICEETCAVHVEQTLWILMGLIPLLALVTPFIFGLTWRCLGICLLFIMAVIVWRTISLVFFYLMTASHYRHNII